MKILGISFIALFLTICTVLFIKGVTFNQNCGGHLERAANANTVELAVKELNVAIDYMEKNDLTQGYTSVIYRTPDEDISYWYNNIKNSRDELLQLPLNTTSLEKSNMLMKLRETLLDQDKDGTKITKPEGISKYPYNIFWFFITSISIILLIAGIFIILAYFD